MSALFFQKWHDRDENHKSRICPGDWLSGQRNTIPDTSDVWYDLGVGVSKIWIPPWAEHLLVRVHLAINPLGGVESAYVGKARPKIGTAYGTEMQVWLECVYDFSGGPFGEEAVCTDDVPGADGWPSSGVLFPKQSVIEIPASMRDTEQDLSYEVKKIGNAIGYVRVFNDPRDATNGHKHRHWLFLEAA